LGHPVFSDIQVWFLFIGRYFKLDQFKTKSLKWMANSFLIFCTSTLVKTATCKLSVLV